MTEVATCDATRRLFTAAEVRDNGGKGCDILEAGL